MKTRILKHVFILVSFMMFSKAFALSSGDVSVRLISGYFWMDNSCTAGGPRGKVVSFRVKNTKGSPLQGVTVTIGTIAFTATGGASYTSGTPAFATQTSTSVYIGNIATGDSATAFFFVGYNCLIYPNNTNITTDYLTIPLTVKDVNPGTVTTNFTKNTYVLRNSNNNTITIIATTANLVGTMLTLSVAYNISNVKPGNIIDMELSTTNTFPAGYAIMGCKFTASTITSDFPVNMINTHYSDGIVSNLPSGGTVTIEWTLKITSAITGITASNIIPFVVSDAGSSQRWQANTTTFTGTSTPTNSLSITKRVNTPNVLVNDTVLYTIVISNSSSVADVTIDKLIDNLPRDYSFKYMESNVGVFPRLVTYSNCTVYPVYQDTNYLNFFGQKEISSGVFSWVVPKNDSIKLIYSVKVSPTIGMNDTNFITAYVGSSPVGTAFAKVNILAFLPLSVLDFNVVKAANGMELSWTVTGDNDFSRFNVYRLSSEDGSYIKINEFGSTDEPWYVYHCLDQSAFETNSGYLEYKLEKVDMNGNISTYFASIELSTGETRFSVMRLDNGSVGIGNINPAIHNVHVMVNDVNGRILYDGNVERTGLLFLVPCDLSNELGTCVFLTVEKASMRLTEKIIVE